jgi:sugar phosphate isomerase/epimerase
VRHVHAKDKSRDGENVRFGTGIADLAGVLATLAGDGYDGLITMEATRGDDPVTTATEHRDFLLARLHDAVPGRPA